MIRHIFKIIWNERKVNAWLIVEYMLVFCILWFCFDYISTMIRNHLEDTGFDIENVYMINMGEKPTEAFENQPELEGDKYSWALTLMDRVKRHPDVEYVGLSQAAVPYGMSMTTSSFIIEPDSDFVSIQCRNVTSEFFDVFKIEFDQGSVFDWQDESSKSQVIISPYKDDFFGDRRKDNLYPISQVHTLRRNSNSTDFINVVGVVNKVRSNYFEPFVSNAFFPLKKEDVNLAWDQIAIRVKPGTDKNFPERFIKDMREQLLIGPYFLASVTPMSEIKEIAVNANGVSSALNSTYSIMAFLIVNIFLGILGTFWFRTQSRQSEVGLRIALGSSKQKVKSMLITETILLLLIASVAGVVICLNLGSTEILTDIGVPNINREKWGIGHEQDIIDFSLTFIFLAIISVLAVWYPAKQASDIQPAEALRDE